MMQEISIDEAKGKTVSGAEFLYKLFSKLRLPLSNEKALQAAISVALTASGIKHDREVRLSDKDCIDFMVGSVGMEVKLKGPAVAIYKQCKRYCGYPEVQELLIVTNRSMGLPNEIDGKPTYLLSLGKGWL